METKDCILTRRSVRKFTDRKVEHRLVEQIISLAAMPLLEEHPDQPVYCH